MRGALDQSPLAHGAFPMKALFSSLLLAAVVPAFADDTSNPRCAAKEADIEQQIRIAEEAGQSGRVRGLNTALQQVRSHCTDAGLQRELQDKVNEARAEVREREADLREAELDGDADKIAKRQAKLEEARSELQEAEAALHP
ncbi:DUF1090 domain-containing protein [Pseudomonas dryadis]|uniref:DUF1090 domain-containing protein n=2 Tax=Phytopseudomonas dryadis TaxID=2487520 RepID=A0A4Q9QWB9_9GAMM|nr:DUF1090 domain-containing protein [Pseudomonas dryadis]